LSRIEREKVQDFVKDKLKKRYIRPLKSLQILPVFNYSLPLVLDLIDSTGKKMVFIKIDLK